MIRRSGGRSCCQNLERPLARVQDLVGKLVSFGGPVDMLCLVGAWGAGGGCVNAGIGPRWRSVRPSARSRPPMAGRPILDPLSE
jgi:hypothetical protein